MPRSVAADQIGSKRGCMIGIPGTGIVPIRKVRLPRSRMNAISATAASTSSKSRQVTGRSRSVWPSTASASQRVARRMTSRARRRSSRNRALIIPSRQMTVSTSMPLSSSHATAARRVGRTVHRGAFVPVVVGLAPRGRRWRRCREAPAPPTTATARVARGKDVAGDDLRRHLGGVELRQTVTQARVVVEPRAAWLEV